MKPWRSLSRQRVLSGKVFCYHQHTNQSLESGKTGVFDVLECPDWVNIIAVNSKRELLLVEQFRHGIGSTTYEIPGGAVDPKDASPLEAAKRELLEESGCLAEKWVHLGYVHPNPAMMNNCCFFYLAENFYQSSSQQLDPLEEITLHRIPLVDFPKLVSEGKITHSLVVAAFYYYNIYNKV